MSATRRGFFSFLAATPLAAKEAADAVAAGLMKTDVKSGLGWLPQHAHDYGASLGSGQPAGPNDDPFDKSAAWIKLNGIPEFYLKELRLRTRSIEYLEPDIAIKKSWSLSVKIMTQQQRNFDREVERIKAGNSNKGWRLFEKLSGFRWPWA